MKKIALLLAAALALTGCTANSQEMAKPEIEVTDVWIKSSETSVTGGMTALFGTITNNTDQELVLVGGATEVAGVVEIHEMAMSGGEMVMQAIEGGLVIPAGESATLEPGGNHMMLMDLKTDVVAGDEVVVTFDFGTVDLTIESVVAKPTVGGDEDYHSEEGMDH
jgi:copper(I)-binding protein